MIDFTPREDSQGRLVLKTKDYVLGVRGEILEEEECWRGKV